MNDGLWVDQAETVAAASAFFVFPCKEPSKRTTISAFKERRFVAANAASVFFSSVGKRSLNCSIINTPFSMPNWHHCDYALMRVMSTRHQFRVGIMTRYPSEEKDRFIVRMPDGMRDQLKGIAAKNGRSLNAEIIARLSETLETDKALDSPALAGEALAPIVATIKAEVAATYEKRLASMENLLVGIADQIAGGKISDTEKRHLANRLKTRKGDDSGPEGEDK